MKDVTVTSFGLIIAFLLPGFIGLYGLSFRLPPLRTTFNTFQTAESNVGLFLVVILASLCLGLVANGVRWIVYDVWFSGSTDQIGKLYARLTGERKLEAYRMVIDELHRHYQWWGAASVMLPVLYLGWITSPDASALDLGTKVAISIAFLVLEPLAIFSAWKLRIATLVNIRAILEGG